MKKYFVNGVLYEPMDDESYYERSKYTDHFIVALFWFIVWSFKYDGVDLMRRK